jgi:hypothetical protein
MFTMGSSSEKGDYTDDDSPEFNLERVQFRKVLP